MEKVKYVNYDKWEVYEGISEGSGRAEKKWLISPEGQIGLFKYPKDENTTEHISEHLAFKIAEMLEIETAKVDIGIYKGRKGSMSYLLNKDNEAIVEGGTYITGIHPDYDLEQTMETESGRYYCLDHILEVIQEPELSDEWIKMLVFDFLIGNSDRHQNNWGFIIKSGNVGDDQNRRMCPLYDNGSSLCSYINEMQIKNYLGNDKIKFNALVDTKSKSMIRIDGEEKKKPRHSEMMSYLLKTNVATESICDKIIKTLSKRVIDELLDSYCEVISNQKIELLKRYLLAKIELLKELVRGDS